MFPAHLPKVNISIFNEDRLMVLILLNGRNKENPECKQSLLLKLYIFDFKLTLFRTKLLSEFVVGSEKI